MGEYQLDEEICKAIVDGTLKGYLQYLEERKQKKETMNISGAYAWTKGNHIDDQVSKLGQEKGLGFKIEKAGYTWEYLQFTVEDNAEQFMVIIKNSHRLNQTFDGKSKKRNDTNYLIELSNINSPLLESISQSYIKEQGQIELELNEIEEVKAVLESTSLKVTQQYNRFYIVTYEINSETKFIDSIKLMMPHSQTMSLFLIEDLTKLIEESEYEIAFEDVESIKDEISSDKSIFSGGVNAFDYSVPATEEESNN